jgi:hypothetical protein
MTFQRRWLASAALAVAISSSALAAEPIDRSQLEKLQALIKPPESEAVWTTIPWLTSLWEARRQAAAEGKPILLWEMDGHPLGCT